MPPRPAPDYRADEHIEQTADAYNQPAFSLANRLRRLVWNVVWVLLYRLSPRPLHVWRAALLRMFGATLGPHCHFYPRARIWAPWNLHCEDHVAVADGAEIYNPAPVVLASHVILSQESYLCGATHDYNDPRFPLIAYSMRVEAYAWVCARASILPGVHIGTGAVLGLGSIASRDLEPWTVYSGNPAVAVRRRQHPLNDTTVATHPNPDTKP